MTRAFLQLVNHAITAGWMVLVVLALRLLLRKASMRLRIFLWALIAVRLLLPVSIESAYSLVPSAETVSLAPITGESKTQGDTGERIVIETGFPAVDRALNPSNTLAAKHTGTVAALKTTAWIVWLGVALGMLAFALIRFILLKRRVRASIRWRAGVYLCDELKSPFLFGMLSPKIYLPSGMDPETREYALMHEQAHRQCGDHIIKPLAYLLLCVYWFHPLLWLSYALLCRDLEFACDERATRALDAKRKAAYCDALLACSHAPRGFSARALSFVAAPVKARILAVLRARCPSRLCGVLGVLAGMLAAFCFLTVPKATVPPPHPCLSAEEQLYGTWTLDRLEYRNCVDGNLYSLRHEQLDSRLHMTFLPDGVAEVCTHPGTKDSLMTYTVAENRVIICGKERSDAQTMPCFLQATYDPQTDSLSLSVRPLTTETYTRAPEQNRKADVPASASAFNESTNSPTSYH